MGRSPCCAKEGLNRGAWTAGEDKILIDYIKTHGEGKWRNLPKKAGLKRCGKSCRLRWLNYLRPDIKRGNISHDEEELIIRLHRLLGNRWSLIAGRLPGRTDNEIKNYWNTNIGKKLQQKQQQYPSSSSRKPAYQCPENPKFAVKKPVSQPGKAARESYPIRTKATKCTKVFMTNPEAPKFVQVVRQKQMMMETSMANRSDDQNVNKETSELLPEFNLEENDPSDFMIDFEMDEHFLSFLNTDFAELPNFEDTSGVGDRRSTRNTNSEEINLLISEDKQKLREMDFPRMDSIIGSEFEWFN